MLRISGNLCKPPLQVFDVCLVYLCFCMICLASTMSTVTVYWLKLACHKNEFFYNTTGCDSAKVSPTRKNCYMVQSCSRFPLSSPMYGSGLLCVKWGSTNTGWHIDVHHVKTLPHTCSLKLNIIGIWEWGIYGLMGGPFIT